MTCKLSIEISIHQIVVSNVILLFMACVSISAQCIDVIHSVSILHGLC